jgi:hypothetical protein
VEHDSIQFKAAPWAQRGRADHIGGMLVSLPCPEGSEAIEGVRIGRNGFGGGAEIVAQRPDGDRLMLIARCAACGTLYRLPEWSDARPFAEACEAEAKSHDRHGGARSATFWRKVADRIAAGYPDNDWAPVRGRK